MFQLTHVSINARLYSVQRHAVFDIYLPSHLCSFTFWINMPSKFLNATSSLLTCLNLASCVDLQFDFPKLEELSFTLSGGSSPNVLDSITNCSKLRSLRLGIDLHKLPSAFTIQSLVQMAENMNHLSKLKIHPYGYTKEMNGRIAIKQNGYSLTRNFSFKLPIGIIFYPLNTFHKLTIDNGLCLENEAQQISYSFQNNVNLSLIIDTDRDQVTYVIIRKSRDDPHYSNEFISQLKYFTQVETVELDLDFEYSFLEKVVIPWLHSLASLKLIKANGLEAYNRDIKKIMLDLGCPKAPFSERNSSIDSLSDME